MALSTFHPNHGRFLGLLLFCHVFTAKAQVLFWSDHFAGGLVSGGFSTGTIGQGAGSFDMPIPAGSTIHRAYFFATQVGSITAPITAELNGMPYTFDASNFNGPPFLSSYGGISGVHAIDVTGDLDPAVTHYTISVPTQPSSVENVYTEFYLVIAYAHAGYAPMTADLYLTDQNADGFNGYTLHTSAPMENDVPIGFATVGGYAADINNDCESVTVNGTLLGDFAGGDFNSADPDFGAMGAMAYANGTLTGLGDDNADQAINGTDVVSDLSGLVTNGSSTLHVIFSQCAGNDSNHLWMMLVAFGSDPCSTPLALGADTALCAGDTLVLHAERPNATYHWQDGSTEADLTVTQTGTYTVEVTNAQCMWRDTIAVQFTPLPVVDLGGPFTLCRGDILVLDAGDPNAQFLWADGSTGPQLEVDSTLHTWVQVTRSGCTASDTVDVDEEDCVTWLAMPNVFSPNGDPENPLFEPKGMGGIAELSIKVLNRWGKVLHETSGFRSSWDGRDSGGSAVPEGTYYWVAHFTDDRGDTHEQHGAVTLLR